MEDKPDQPRRFFVLSTLPFSSPFWGALMNRMVGRDGMMTGGDGMRISGQDDTRLPGWDVMGWEDMWMMGQDGTMKKDLRKMIL